MNKGGAEARKGSGVRWGGVARKGIRALPGHPALEEVWRWVWGITEGPNTADEIKQQEGYMHISRDSQVEFSA